MSDFLVGAVAAERDHGLVHAFDHGRIRGIRLLLQRTHHPVFDQAENRLHAQKGLLAVVMGGA